MRIGPWWTGSLVDILSVPEGTRKRPAARVEARRPRTVPSSGNLRGDSLRQRAVGPRSDRRQRWMEGYDRVRDPDAPCSATTSTCLGELLAHPRTLAGEVVRQHVVYSAKLGEAVLDVTTTMLVKPGTCETWSHSPYRRITNGIGCDFDRDE
jgi:hypothetical protein